jgi:hypothetical protein
VSNAWLMTLLCKKNIIAKSEEVKNRWSSSRHIARKRQVRQNLLRKAMAEKGCFVDDVYVHMSSKNTNFHIFI